MLGIHYDWLSRLASLLWQRVIIITIIEEQQQQQQLLLPASCCATPGVSLHLQQAPELRLGLRFVHMGEVVECQRMPMNLQGGEEGETNSLQRQPILA